MNKTIEDMKFINAFLIFIVAFLLYNPKDSIIVDVIVFITGFLAIASSHLIKQYTISSSVFFVISSLYFAIVCKELNLIGEEFANMFVAIPFNMVILFDTARIHDNCGQRNSQCGSRWLFNVYFGFMIVGALFITVYYLRLVNSVYPEIEGAGIVLLALALIAEYKKSNIASSLWAMRSLLQIYIWYYVGTRPYITLLWVFYFIHMVLMRVSEYNEEHDDS